MASFNVISTSSSCVGASAEDLPLNQLTVFPKLPAELRLKIWKMTFRRRKISLSLHPSETERENTFPATLFINKESRSETLKSYFFLHRKQNLLAHSRNVFDGLICLNPDLDLAALDFLEVFCSYSSIAAYLEYVDSVLPGGLVGIKELELMAMHWDGLVKLGFEGSSELQYIVATPV